MTDNLTSLLEQSAALHHHLCPRQVLGVRMGMLAGKLLALELPQTNKRLLTIVETDGCFNDGISVATNCWVGRRTMRVEDLGKVAATFVDTRTETAVRLFPSPHVRQLAPTCAPEAQNRWQGYLLGYQRIPDEDLFVFQQVQLHIPVSQLISRAGARVVCDACGEEIINEREVALVQTVLCRTCAGGGYYTVAAGGHMPIAVPALSAPISYGARDWFVNGEHNDSV
ncbi:MAG TPA: FmdE family protein [Chloroflexota bacterium]|nr:FmdE family protein [Chloroflexota bacterium]